MANEVQECRVRASDRLTSVDNALWLLQLVAERQALRVSEAADLLGVARSTAHRLLSALRRRDFLMQDKPNGVYRPGPALHAIGMAAISRIDIRRIAQPVLEQLRDQTGETSSLAILEGTMARFIECCEGLSAVRVGSRTGIVRYAHASAIGKAMLAALPDTELNRRYPGEELPAATPASITTRRQLIAELGQVQAAGVRAQLGGELRRRLGGGGRTASTPRERRSRRSASRCRACGPAASQASARWLRTCARRRADPGAAAPPERAGAVRPERAVAWIGPAARVGGPPDRV